MNTLERWIEQAVQLCRPDHVHLCDGSEAENQTLLQQLVAKGTFVPVKHNSFWCHSAESDVARVEEATYICSLHPDDAGPTNRWKDPHEMKSLLTRLFSGCMQGRTLYVIPFCMGPINSPMSLIGVQITDSPYVVCNMRIMTRMGTPVLNRLKASSEAFIPCMHSVGVPLTPGQIDMPWPCRTDHKYIVHFPEEKSIWSFGSGYGGNALLGKKSLALRIASVVARDEGWLAEHMLIMGITSPQGQKKYIAAAFPSACGKTNLAMLTPTLPGWKVECVGDDIAWMRFKEDGHLYALNPEAGFFGVAPGTSWKSNRVAMETLEKGAIFTNTARTEEGDVWWEGLTEAPPFHLIDWTGKRWDPAAKKPAAHPNARFTVAASQCPMIDPHWEDPEGVPISAIIFGGRRATTVPLIYQATDWKQGIFVGASLSSEMTAAAGGSVGTLRHDPFAMLPFCGYHMGDYFTHWMKLGEGKKHLPPIFYVNWFRKEEGKFLWPGFGENIRVLKWIFERTDGKRDVRTTPAGLVPYAADIDLTGLALEPSVLDQLLTVDPVAWEAELAESRQYLAQFAPRYIF